jgi:hypothetical protein
MIMIAERAAVRASQPSQRGVRNRRTQVSLRG